MEAPERPPAVPPVYSSPCPDHEPEIPPWGTAVGGQFGDCVVCWESGRHLQIQCFLCQQMPGCCECLSMVTLNNIKLRAKWEGFFVVKVLKSSYKLKTILI